MQFVVEKSKSHLYVVSTLLEAVASIYICCDCDIQAHLVLFYTVTRGSNQFSCHQFAGGCVVIFDVGIRVHVHLFVHLVASRAGRWGKVGVRWGEVG